MKNKLTVIDFFCGAGGFSEGFRQQGFKIVQGIDYWRPAIDTHNLNHGLNDTTKSVLDFWSEDHGDVIEIEKLEDTTCIIGSPPCVSFSSSNKSGKADKTHGIQLIESFLRVIAVKKHKKDSKLKVWYMENVPNSQDYVKEIYTFEMLNLGKWAKSIGKNPTDEALKVQNNGKILNSGDYGAPQSRKRFICGEWCETGEFLSPKETHKNHITSGEILGKLPKPNTPKKEVIKNKIKDPNYGNLVIDGDKLMDHFYDTGLYIIEWDEARYLKQNHSYMGKMAFPENKDKPCRTIMATRSAKTRESLIYKSEYSRKGNGEYRLPTIREIASLMGFPINYQFTGSEGSKWRQIGNAVSPHLSAALAKIIRAKLGLSEINKIDFSSLDNGYEAVEIKLNTFSEMKFDKPKKRNMNAKFRKHPCKSGNITVELMNYLKDDDTPGENWYIQMYFGTGVGFNQMIIDKNKYKIIEKYLNDKVKNFKSFKIDFGEYYDTIGKINAKKLQKSFEQDPNLISLKNPINILKNVDNLIQKREERDDFIVIDIIPKNEIPVGQMYVAYCLGKLIF